MKCSSPDRIDVPVRRPSVAETGAIRSSRRSHGNAVPEPDNPQSKPPFLQGYADLLREYVHEDSSVDYGALHRRRLDMQQLL